MSATSAPQRQRPVLVTRDPAHRLLAGVAAAAGRRLGVDATYVRVAFAVLALAGGAGVLAYLVLWAVTPEAAGGDDGPAPAPNLQRAVAFGTQVLGAMLVLRAAGLWLGDPLVWPLTLAALGSCVLWARSDDVDRARWSALAPGGDRSVQVWLSAEASLPRRLAGGLLVLAGVIALLVANIELGDIGGAAVAFVLAVLGLTLLLGPAVVRLLQQVAAERRERIRSDERADIGAHLHDSVLHTLALIQRSESPQEMVTLARSQERELRTWLQGRSRSHGDTTLRGSLEDLAARIEARDHVSVDLVVVGDAPLDAQMEAVTAAVGEAVTNAARHAGVDDVSVYVEVEPAAVTAYVRDEGKGFDLSAVPDDRRGLQHSIRGRIERQGGSVSIDTAPDEGTEVMLTLPRRSA